MHAAGKWFNKLINNEENNVLSENNDLSGKIEIDLSKEKRNEIRKVFLKTLRRVLILKATIEIKKEEMADSAKIDDIRIPIFDGINFSSWKFRLLTVLEYKECDKPAIGEKPETESLANWKKLDLKARAILINCVSDKQLEYLKECTTTLQMMNKLESLYSTKSTTLQIINRNKLEQIKLKNYNTVEEFFIDFEKACNEFKKAGGTLSEEEKMKYVIRALPTSYAYIGDFVDLVPEAQRTVELVKSKIQEKSLNTSESNNKSNASTFNVRSKGQCFKCGKIGHHKKDCWQNRQQHYPGSSRGQRGSHSGNSRGYNHHGRGRGYGYQQQAENNGQQQSSTHESWATQVVHVNMNQCSESENKNKNVIEWLLDSGCTDHIVNNEKYFYDVENLSEPIDVSLPNGKLLKATKIGSVRTVFKTYYHKTNVELKNVFYVQNMKRNLLSVAKITENNKVVAAGNYAKIYNRNSELTAVAEKKDGMYEMKSFVCKNESCNNVRINSVRMTDKEKWHRALGHVNFKYLNKLVNNKLVDGLPETLEKDFMKCENCIQSKMANVPFENKHSRAKEILEIIHTDLNGPHRTTGFNGEKYFVTFIDDYSRCTKLFCIKSKDETADCFIEFVNLVKNQFGKCIKKLRCDNGREYLNKRIYDFAKSKGIEIITCPPYVHELNGVAERYNRSAMDMGRCLAREAKIDYKYWPEIMKTVAYLKNRTIANTYENKTPYEIFFGNKPNVKNLKIYGSKVFIRTPEVLRKSKWDNKAKIGILVGYNSNSYRVLVNGKIIDARHVEIIENENELICKSDNMNKNDRVTFVNVENDSSSPMSSFEKRRTSNTNENVVSENDNEQNINNEIENERSESSEDVNEQNLVVKRISQRKKSPINRYGNPVTYCISVNYVDVNVPQTFEEAWNCEENEKWKNAMNDEMRKLNEYKTWSLVERKKGKDIIDTKWVYTKKLNGRYKARLVARGFKQKNVIDDIYAPVASNETIKFLLSYCCQNGLKIEIVDIDSAFLYGDIVSEVYIEQPQGFSNKTDKVLKLEKSMYGLSESPRDWYECFNEYVESLGFRKGNVELCLYVHGTGDDKVYLMNYVDDIIICCKTKEKIKDIKRLLAKRFKLKDIGEIKEYLGIEVEYNIERNEMKLSQSKYIEKLAEKYNILDSKLYNTPMEIKLNVEKSDCCDENIMYKNLLGALLYISSGTRPDVSFSVNYLSRFQNCYTSTHFKYALRILKYLYATKDMKLCYNKNESCEIIDCYVDADWAGDHIDRKSTTGYTIRLYGNLIYWKSRKQKCITKASTYAEYVALSELVTEVKYITELSKFFEIELENPIKIYEDNSGVIDIAKCGNFTKNSKHIEIHYHYVHECVKQGLIDVVKVDSENNLADIFTKALCREKFEKFRKLLNLL